jgi:hypothetical protein
MSGLIAKLLAVVAFTFGKQLLRLFKALFRFQHGFVKNF